MSSDSFSNPANLDPRLRDDPVMEFLTTAQQYTETHNPGADGDQSEENNEDIPVRIQVSTQGDGQTPSLPPLPWLQALPLLAKSSSASRSLKENSRQSLTTIVQ